jgi:hypothetical protein
MWTKIKDCAGSIAAVLSMVGIIFGGYFYIDYRYALAEELEKTKSRLEQKISQDRVNWIQERLWKMDDRHQERKPTDLEKEEIRKLKQEKEQIEKNLEPKK